MEKTSGVEVETVVLGRQGNSYSRQCCVIFLIELIIFRNTI